MLFSPGGERLKTVLWNLCLLAASRLKLFMIVTGGRNPGILFPGFWTVCHPWTVSMVSENIWTDGRRLTRQDSGRSWRTREKKKAFQINNANDDIISHIFIPRFMMKDKRMTIKWDFLGGSVVKTPNAGDLSSVPSQETGFNPWSGS